MSAWTTAFSDVAFLATLSTLVTYLFSGKWKFFLSWALVAQAFAFSLILGFVVLLRFFVHAPVTQEPESFMYIRFYMYLVIAIVQTTVAVGFIRARFLKKRIEYLEGEVSRANNA